MKIRLYLKRFSFTYSFISNKRQDKSVTLTKNVVHCTIWFPAMKYNILNAIFFYDFFYLIQK